MSDGEWADEVSPLGSASKGRDSGGMRAPRGAIVESMTIGGLASRPDGGSKGDAEDVVIGPRGTRALSAGAQRMLANIDKHDDVNDSPRAAAGATDAGVTPPTPPVAAPPAAVAAAPTTEPAPDPGAEHRERAERLAEHNRRLVGELETLRGRPARGERTDREKALDEAERNYHDVSIGSLRRFVAAALGESDPASKAVDAELSGLYRDLTERELGVPLDSGVKATREAERTRRMLERDRRDRAAEQARPAEDPSVKQAAEVTSLIDSRLSARNAEGKTHVERYPLLHGFAGDIDGVKPSELIWKAIQRGIHAGELDPKTPDEQLIEAVSSKIEPHYQALADRLVKARTPASTAAPTQATDATAPKADPPGNGVRTITNASASVAPATPPAAKPATTTESAQPPKNLTEKQRRKWWADHLFKD